MAPLTAAFWQSAPRSVTYLCRPEHFRMFVFSIQTCRLSSMWERAGGSDPQLWILRLTSPTSLPLNDVRFLNATTGWIAETRACSARQTAVRRKLPERQRSKAVFFIDATKGWVCGNDGFIAHSTNGGRSWTPQAGDWPDKLSDI